MVSFLYEIKFFSFRPKTMDYSPWFDFSSPKMFVRKVWHFKEYVKRNLMALFQSHSTFIWVATSI